MKEEAGQLRKKLTEFLSRNRYVLLVALVGAVLLTIPGPGGEEKQSGEGGPPAALVQPDPFQPEAMERKLERVLSGIAGAGEVRVALTVREGPKRIMARDGTAREGTEKELTSTTVIVSRGGQGEDGVTVQEIGPQYQGAVVVTSGAEDPAVRLAVSEAVSALTGLGADKISICRGG